MLQLLRGFCISLSVAQFDLGVNVLGCPVLGGLAALSFLTLDLCAFRSISNNAKSFVLGKRLFCFLIV